MYARGAAPQARAQYQMSQVPQQSQIVTSHKLQELVSQIDETEQLDDEVAAVGYLPCS